MKSPEELNKLATAFEKQAQDMQVSQQGTTELFFGSEDKQRAFNAAIQDPKSPVAQVLLNYYNKSNGKPTSFALSVSAQPNVGAKWSLVTTPPTLAGPVAKAVDAVYRKSVGKSMSETQRIADAVSKKGGGSGPLEVGSLDFT